MDDKDIANLVGRFRNSAKLYNELAGNCAVNFVKTGDIEHKEQAIFHLRAAEIWEEAKNDVVHASNEAAKRKHLENPGKG